MNNMATIQSQLREMIGEVAYTPNQIADMLTHMDLGMYASPERIRIYVRKHDLLVDLEKVGVQPSRKSRTTCLVPKSNLVQIIEGMHIPATEKNFEDAAYALGYQL